MTMKVVLKHYCKIIMTFVTTIETLIEILIKIFKIKRGFAPPIMGTILKGRNNTYNVRNFQEFETEKEEQYFCLETFSYRTPQLWSFLLEHMRQLNSIHQFKRSARKWVCNPCPCRLCKVYLQNVRFL